MILSSFSSALRATCPCTSACQTPASSCVPSCSPSASPRVQRHFQGLRAADRGFPVPWASHDGRPLLCELAGPPKPFKCQASADPQREASASAPATSSSEVIGNKQEGLVSGSPVVITEAPPMLKTAEPMPMMRPNRGLIKAGDAGRIMDRRPKDVWAIRFAVGAYLVDRKYFEALNDD